MDSQQAEQLKCLASEFSRHIRENEECLSLFINFMSSDHNAELNMLIERLRHQERIQEHNAVNDAIEGI